MFFFDLVVFGNFDEDGYVIGLLIILELGMMRMFVGGCVCIIFLLVFNSEILCIIKVVLIIDKEGCCGLFYFVIMRFMWF